MKRIPLTQGQFALVDDEDYERLIIHTWHAERRRRTFYAATSIGNVKLRMHRLVLGAPKGVEVDHANRNGLDNRRRNLRPCTRGQNECNKVARAKCSSRFKGVTLRRTEYPLSKPWMAQIKMDRKYRYLGYFKTEELAAREYDKAARLLHGDFAVVNFPQEECK